MVTARMASHHFLILTVLQYFSISQALNFAIFGIPMFGVDTCGFNGNTDEELCNRWMQLSAFFPFYRNHNVLSAIPQEAFRWASVIEASKKAMAIRYSLLPYMYTLFYYASTTGSTVMRALFWEASPISCLTTWSPLTSHSSPTTLPSPPSTTSSSSAQRLWSLQPSARARRRFRLSSPAWPMAKCGTTGTRKR